MPSIAILKRDMVKAGGLEKHTSRIIQKFQDRGFSITLVTASPSFFQKNISVVSHPLKSSLNYKKIDEFDEFSHTFLSNSPHDIVLGMDRTRYQTHIRAGNGVHAAYLDLRKKQEGFWKRISFSLNPLHRLLLSIEREAFESPSLRAIIVNSAFVKEQILHYYTTESSKIHVLHNGVEWHEMEKPFQEWPEKKQHGAYHFLFIGHNFERKGLKELLVALSQLSAKNFHLSIIGEDKNSAHYETLANNLNLATHVSFLGKVDDPIPFYQKADCLVIPSLYDPFANVTVEALAMGLFVISSSNNGGKEVLTKESGIALGSDQSFVPALESALSKPKTLASSQKIRDSVKHLDFDHQLNKFCDLCLI
jgi:UDP-glucose:(heptosyl)LPS alpha-1,3-glucosyltransferase